MSLSRRSDYQKIYSAYQGAGRDVYVPTEYHSTFEKILAEYRTNYHMTSIFRQIVSLNANPLQGRRVNNGGDLYEVKNGNIAMQYCIYEGAVLINYLQITTMKVDERFGLYPVEWREDRGRWESADKSVGSLNSDHQWKSKSGKAHYGAVAGRFGSIADAARLLPDHVINAYQKSDYLTSSDANTSLSMFWIKKGQHKSHDAAKALASIMQQSSKSELPVNWLIHDAGTDTFKAAARIVVQNPLADIKARAKDAATGSVQQQNVYFSNPNTSSIKSLEKLCQEAGFNYIGTNTSNRDLRRIGTIKNVGVELGKTLSTAVAAGAAVDTSLALRQVGAGSAEKVINNGFNALLTGNFFGVAAAITATGFIAVGVYNRSKPIAAGIHCTFGRGNQKWYTTDDELIG